MLSEIELARNYCRDSIAEVPRIKNMNFGMCEKLCEAQGFRGLGLIPSTAQISNIKYSH